MTVTPPVVITRWERFKRSTVWHPLHTNPEDDNRSGPRFWYPAYYLISFWLGAYAVWRGSPLLNIIFPHWFTDGLGVVIMVASVASLVGVIFPKLNIVELIGHLALVFMLGYYAGTVAVLAPNPELNGFVVLILIMSIWLLGPRTTRLFIQVSKVRAARDTVLK